MPRPPALDRMVILRLRGAGVSGAEALRGLLYKPYVRTAVVNGRGLPHRLVPGTAQNGLLMSVPPAADLPPPLRLLPEPVRTVQVTRGGKPPGGPVLRYEFFEVPVRP